VNVVVRGEVPMGYQRFFSVPGVSERIRQIRERVRNVDWKEVGEKINALWIPDGGVCDKRKFVAFFVDGSVNQGVPVSTGVLYAISAAGQVVIYQPQEVELSDEWDRDLSCVKQAEAVSRQALVDELLLCDLGIIRNAEHARKYLDTYMAAMEYKVAALGVVKGIDLIVMDRSLVWLVKRQVFSQKLDTLLDEYGFEESERERIAEAGYEFAERVKERASAELEKGVGRRGFEHLRCFSLEALWEDVPSSLSLEAQECVRTYGVMAEAQVYADVCASARAIVGVTKTSSSTALMERAGLRNLPYTDMGLLNVLIGFRKLPPGRSVVLERKRKEGLGVLNYFFALFPANHPGGVHPVLVEFLADDASPEEKADEVYRLVKRTCFDKRGLSRGYPYYLRAVHETAKIDRSVMNAFTACCGVLPVTGREHVGEGGVAWEKITKGFTITK